MRLLVLTDRDWTHPQGGGTGTNLYGLVSRWLADGHEVTVLACGYPGAEAVEQPAEGLTIRRVGGRSTLFLRAPFTVPRDHDVVLETVNGIAFLTPLWLRRPRVTLVHHVHRDMYVEELGRTGALAAWLLETLPLRLLYRGTPFITGSNASRDALAELGIPPETVDVVHYGVEHSAFAPAAERYPERTLLYLGRLKRYKRLETLFDVLERLPGDVRLEIAGDGDHRPVLEQEVARRGLGDRIRFLGHVSEEVKRELYARSWLTLTASSAEGWCLTVTEAAACGTASGALRVGGLTESIVDGETGVLADDAEELAGKVRAVLEDPALRERLGARAQEHAAQFTWDRTAAGTLDVLRRAAAAPRARLRPSLWRAAGGLAAATILANALSLLLIMVVARALGAGGYGALAAVTSLLLMVLVPGTALQVAGARIGDRPLAWAALLAGAGGVVLRDPLATLGGVPGAGWAAAAVPLTGVLGVWVSVRRGALQAAGRPGRVAAGVLTEAGARFCLGAGLALAGAGVTGVVLATPLALLAGLALTLRAPSGRVPARTVLWPVAGLALLAVVQHVDVLVAQHRWAPEQAGAYAAATVAAKVIVWVAIGLALALLPELSRRARAGGADEGLLARTLALVGAACVPLVLACVLLPSQLLSVVFGAELDAAADALPWLALAMALFAFAVVAVQHALAVGRIGVLTLVAVAAVVEPVLLRATATGPEGFGTLLFGLNLALALAALVVALGPGRTAA